MSKYGKKRSKTEQQEQLYREAMAQKRGKLPPPFFVAPSGMDLSDIDRQVKIAHKLCDVLDCKLLRYENGWIAYEPDGKVLAVLTLLYQPVTDPVDVRAWGAIRASEIAAKLNVWHYVLVSRQEEGVHYVKIPLESHHYRVGILDEDMGKELLMSIPFKHFKRAHPDLLRDHHA